MAVFDKVIISLLAVATLGVTNTSLYADVMDEPIATSTPTNVEEYMSVDVDLGQMGETGENAVVTTAALETEQTLEATASVEERATVAELPSNEDVVIEEVDETIAEVAEVTSEQPVAEETEATQATEATPVTVTTVTTVTVTVVEPEPTAAPTPAPVSINYPPQGTIEYDLFILVNNARQANGLAPYTYRGDLAAAASVRANEIVVCFDHNRPDGSPYYTVNSSIVYAENLAVGYGSAQEVFDAWMSSPSHRANILDPDYEACGFGFLANYDGISDYYWAQEFGYAD